MYILSVACLLPGVTGDYGGYYTRGLVGPTGGYLLDFFCSSIQFYLLLSPYLCFISLLYLDLNVLGDNTLIG